MRIPASLLLMQAGSLGDVRYFATTDPKIGVTVKYIDPSYMVRSVAANSNDAIMCYELAQNAVHGAMVRRLPCMLFLHPRVGFQCMHGLALKSMYVLATAWVMY